MLNRKFSKVAIFLTFFVYTSSSLNLSYAIGSKITLRVPLLASQEFILMENSKKLVENLKFKALVPVATPQDKNGEIIEADYKREIERMAKTGIRGFFVVGSSGNLKNLKPRQVGQAVGIVKRVMEKLGIDEENYVVASGARGITPKRVVSYMAEAKKAGVHAIVVPSQYYEVPEEEMKEDGESLEDTAEYYREVLRLSEKEGITLPLIMYSISGVSQGRVIDPEAVKALMKGPNKESRIAFIKISEPNMAYLAEIAALGIPTALGFVSCIGAITGGKVINPVDGKTVYIKTPAQIIIPIGANVNPEKFRELEILMEKFSEAVDDQKEEYRHKILEIQKDLAETIHPARYGDENGEGYSNLLDGVNLALHYLGVFREYKVPRRVPRKFRNRVHNELLISEHELTRHEVEVHANMNEDKFKNEIADFITESTDWVADYLPLLGKMTSRQRAEFKKELNKLMIQAYRESVGNGGKVFTRVLVDKGHVIVKVDYEGGTKPLEFRMRKRQERTIKTAGRKMDALRRKVRSRQTASGI